MPVADVLESAVTVGVNRALYTAADAAHHVVSTPANMMVEGAKSATVFVASHLIVGGIKLGCTAGWWLITTAASLVGVAVTAGASATYSTFFAPQEQRKLLTWNNSYDYISLPTSKSMEDSAALLEASPPPSPTAAPMMTRNVANIDD